MSNILAEDITYHTSDIKQGIKKIGPLFKDKNLRNTISKRFQRDNIPNIKQKVWEGKRLSSNEEDKLRQYKFEVSDITLADDNFTCPECPKIEKLTSEVNHILQELGAKSDSMELKTKIGEFEAMYYIFKDTNHPLRDCRGNLGIKEYTKNYNIKDMNLKLLFDKKVTLDDIAALQLHIGQERTYFYRGVYEQKDIWVSVTVKGDRADIKYFKLKKESGEKKIINKVSEIKTKRKDEFSGIFTNLQSIDNRNSFKMKLGLMYELDKQNLPKKVRVLDINSKNEFVWGDTEVNIVLGTDRQQVDMDLNVDGSHNKLMIKSNNGKDFEATLASKVHLIYQYTLEGKVSANKNVYKGNYKLRNPNGDTTYVTTRIDQKNKINDIELGQKIHLDRQSLLSIKLRHNNNKKSTNKGNSAWVYFNAVF